MKSALSAIALFLTLCLSHAEPPSIISYQGRIAVQGAGFSGTGEFNFALINASGSETYWQSNGVALNVAAGLFTVRLGDTSYPNMTALTAAIFTEHDDIWLRVAFKHGVTTEFQTVTPNTRIVSVPYALSAKSAEHAKTAAFGFPANAREFKEAGDFEFNVPAGVTRILVEVWGGGGGQGKNANGSSGAYSRKVIEVTPGDELEISVGNAGAPAIFGPAPDFQVITPATAGGSSKVSKVEIEPFERTVLCVSEGGGGGIGPGTTVIAKPDPTAAIGREGHTLNALSVPASTSGTVSPPVVPVGSAALPLGARGMQGYVLLQW